MRVLDKKEAYSILGLDYDAPLPLIKERYRKLVKQWHPDSGFKGNPALFARISTAYRFLLQEKEKPRRSMEKTQLAIMGEKLLQSKQTREKILAARCLGNSGFRSAYGYLRQALNEKDRDVLKEVIQAIGQLRIRQSAGELAALFSREDRDIRESILVAVETIDGGCSFNNLLLEAMHDKDPGIRMKALKIYSGKDRKPL